MSTDFGDFDLDDAWATEPADPEQVARRLHRLRGSASWDDLTPGEREFGTALGKRLIEVLLDNPDTAAERFHDTVADFSGEPRWAALTRSDRTAGTALIDDILAWLTRQGSLRAGG